jgi:hypothetical protein
MYNPLVRYAAYFENNRDKEESYLFDINNQIETGQEYSPRYLFADERADLDIDIKLKGVDSSTYMYDLYQSLEQIAEELGYSDDIPMWEDKVIKVRDSILSHLWNGLDDMFYDACIIERDGKLIYDMSNVKTLTGFYPFMTDMVEKKQLDAIYKHMLSEKEFWSPYPLTTISMDDTYFNGDAEWKGKRHVCPWNGRVWPITNCHMMEVLAKQSINCPDLRGKLVELIRKTIMMMYSFGDINMPNCYEHYNPLNGHESFYRGVNDYMHSWIVDVILKHAAGVIINEDGITIDPLDFGMDFFELDNLCFKNHIISAIWNRDSGDEAFKIIVDGETVHSSSKFEAVNLTKNI